MARNQRHYDPEYKTQAIKLAQEMDSCKKAADELGISPNTLHGWIYAVNEGRLDIGSGAHSPDNALTLNEELIDIVNNSWHIYHKDISTYAALSKAS